MRSVARFYTVGAAGIIVQLAALALFKSGLGFNYLLATSLAVEFALLHNFFWHERWTWGSRTLASRSGWIGRLLRFHLTNGVFSILGNMAFMAILVGRLRVPYLAANVIAIALCSALNFLAADRFVFRAPKQAE